MDNHRDSKKDRQTRKQGNREKESVRARKSYFGKMLFVWPRNRHSLGSLSLSRWLALVGSRATFEYFGQTREKKKRGQQKKKDEETSRTSGDERDIPANGKYMRNEEVGARKKGETGVSNKNGGMWNGRCGLRVDGGCLNRYMRAYSMAHLLIR